MKATSKKFRIIEHVGIYGHKTYYIQRKFKLFWLIGIWKSLDSLFYYSAIPCSYDSFDDAKTSLESYLNAYEKVVYEI